MRHSKHISFPSDLATTLQRMGSPGGARASAGDIEMRVRSLSWEDPLEEGMAASILAWRIPWTEEPGGLQSIGSQRVGHD